MKNILGMKMFIHVLLYLVKENEIISKVDILKNKKNICTFISKKYKDLINDKFHYSFDDFSNKIDEYLYSICYVIDENYIEYFCNGENEGLFLLLNIIVNNF